MAKLDLFLFEFDVTNKQLLIGLAGLAIAGYIIYQQSKKAIAGAVEVVTKKVNPVSDQNIFYEAQTGIWKAISGSDESLGADIYDLLHPKVDFNVELAQWGGQTPYAVESFDLNIDDYKSLSTETQEALELLAIQGD